MSEEKRQPKTKEELDELKKEVENLRNKLAELTEEELAQVSGGGVPLVPSGSEAGADPCVVSPRSKSVDNPFSLLDNVDKLNRPPTPPSPVAESVKTAVDAALQNW